MLDLKIVYHKKNKKVEPEKRSYHMVYNENSLITALIEKGVKIPNPFSVEISEEVNIDLISSEDVTIHSGC